MIELLNRIFRGVGWYLLPTNRVQVGFRHLIFCVVLGWALNWMADGGSLLGISPAQIPIWSWLGKTSGALAYFADFFVLFFITLPVFFWWHFRVFRSEKDDIGFSPELINPVHLVFIDLFLAFAILMMFAGPHDYPQLACADSSYRFRRGSAGCALLIACHLGATSWVWGPIVFGLILSFLSAVFATFYIIYPFEILFQKWRR